jgi:hypothetical protein
MEAPPHPMRLGESETDYYNLGGSGVAGTKLAAAPQAASGADAAATQETVGKPGNQPPAGEAGPDSALHPPAGPEDGDQP